MRKLFKSSVLILCLFALLSTFAKAEELNCRNFSKRKLDVPDFSQAFDLIALKSVSVTCLENFSGDYDIAYIKGLTLADFESKSIKVFITNKISNTDFLLVVVHEMVHAEQYISWLKSEYFIDEMDEKLNAIHALVKPQGFNASFQTIAAMKRRMEFKSNPRGWFKSYINMRFCMEYQAYQKQADFARLSNYPIEKLPKHLNTLNKDYHESLLKLLNATLVKRLFDRLYSTKELNNVNRICRQGQTPGEWFSASVEALKLQNG